MARRRGHGEGSIYRRQDGRWTASIVLENGKRKYLYGKTQKEVQEKLRTAIQEQKRGILATGPRQTVKAFLEYWLEEVHKPTIRLNSYKIYRNMLDKHVLPELGEVQLQRLTPQHVQALYNKESKAGFSPKSIRTMHAMLQAAFSHAIKLKLISYSPCEAVSLPRLEKHEMQVLSKEQAHKLLEVAKGHRLEVILMVAIVTGMRRGELLALRWQDIDFDKQLLYVRRTVNFIPHHGYVEGEPKTSASKRVIVLPSFVIKALEEHRVHQAEIREQAGKEWEEHDLVFSNNFGRYFNTMILYRKFSTLLEEAGLPHLRFHDLRHSAATILLEMGVQLNVVQELLGHSNITMTLGTYSHVLPSMRKGMIDDLENFFS